MTMMMIVPLFLSFLSIVSQTCATGQGMRHSQNHSSSSVSASSPPIDQFQLHQQFYSHDNRHFFNSTSGRNEESEENEEENEDDDRLSLIFGDIMVPPNMKREDFLVQNETMDRNLANVKTKTKRWDGDYRNDGYFHIPVRLSNFTKSIEEKIVLALRDLQWRSQVITFDFINVNENENEHPYPYPYIHIVNAYGGCWSYIGQVPQLSMSPSGQIINLQQYLCTNFRTIQHEMMHALGFSHEQSRPDRDDYIRILWNNIKEPMLEQFEKLAEGWVNSLGTPYDYNSILHYPPYAFGKGGLDTIEAKNGNVIGNRHNASRLDILQIRLMYQCQSGPRLLDAYNSQRCTVNCPCWKNQNGCGDDDDLCKGDLRCSNNKCEDNLDPSIKKLFRRDAGGDGSIRGKVSGVMFDFQAKENPLKITNLFYQGIEDDVWVDIYTKEYTHFLWSESPERWTLIGQAELKGNGVAPGEPTLLPFNTFNPIKVKSWYRQGFYIQTKNCGDDCNKLTVWTGNHYAENSFPFVEDGTARILEGCALKSLFNNVAGRCLQSRGGNSQTFWGGFRYKVLDKEDRAM